MDLDLTSVLSSLPSAKPSNKGRNSVKSSGAGKTAGALGKPPSGMAQPAKSSTNKPDQFKAVHSNLQSGSGIAQVNYQNTSKTGSKPSGFDQSAANANQPGLLGNTSHGQPKTNYQNSTRFNQPTANPPGGSYQNSTKFVQPALPNQSKYQNSTKFVQPTLPTQSMYQNSAISVQPVAPREPGNQGNSGYTGSNYQHIPPEVSPEMKTFDGYNEKALAALSTNIPQATNPQPLPPITPFYNPQAVPLVPAEPVNPMPTSSPSVPLENIPHSTGRPLPGSTAPAAPIRRSSINQGNKSRGGTTSQSSSNSRSLHSSSFHSATPHRTAPPPPHTSNVDMSTYPRGHAHTSHSVSESTGHRGSSMHPHGHTHTSYSESESSSHRGSSTHPDHMIGHAPSFTHPHSLMDIGEPNSPAYSSDLTSSAGPHFNIGRSMSSSAPTGSILSTDHTMGAGDYYHSNKPSLGPAVTVPPGEGVASQAVLESRRHSSLDSNPAIQINQYSSKCGLSGCG